MGIIYNNWQRGEPCEILLIGNTGQLGWELERTLATLGEVVALDYPSVNLLDEANTRQAVRSVAPKVIVNATGYTAVDKAESEPDIAAAINTARRPSWLKRRMPSARL